MSFPCQRLRRVAACMAAGALSFTAHAAPDAQRGAYLARAADCSACHSEPGRAAGAGGVALKTPFGGIVPPNITPDPATGIGRWTEADFVRALRQGVRRDGLPLYPAMPYGAYTQLSDTDVADLWAWVRTLPPVRHVAAPNTLRFPMNLRPGVAVWQAAYFRPHRFEPRPDKDAAWNRGAYLVQALGHCGDCHTPRNIAMAPVERRALTGARVEGWYAPDISSDALSRLNGRSVDDLEHFLRTGTRPDNTKAIGPMQQVVHDSLSALTDEDLHALAVYLKDQPAVAPPSPSSIAAAPVHDAVADAAGRALYAQHCMTCHQADGRGIAGSVPALAGASAVAAHDPSSVVTAVLQGFDPQGRWAAMPAFAKLLDDGQVAAVANYVRHTWGGQDVGPATPMVSSALRSLAELPPGGSRAALQCPVLDAATMEPALQPGLRALARSGQDAAVLDRLVRGYRAARPQADSADVVQALSSAYCRAITQGHPADARAASRLQTRTAAAVAVYAQQVAQRLAGAAPQAGAAH